MKCGSLDSGEDDKYNADYLVEISEIFMTQDDFLFDRVTPFSMLISVSTRQVPLKRDQRPHSPITTRLLYGLQKMDGA